jgi:uncharacterized membrane protein/DUF4097 and DUF4098 domain-containing protein YvlB
MNKREFLRMLENELSVLDATERQEIIHFYEERFHTSYTYENKTEEEIISELEHPKVIAKNVLEEYGVSKKYVKTKEERYTNYSWVQIVLILSFDVFVVSWLIPTLFSVFVAILGSSLTWVTTLPLILGDRTIVDQYVFAALTGGYVLLFLFSLVILEMILWTIKKVLIWHLNVFKAKRRDQHIKSLNKLSLDRFFKKHRGFRFLKNVALIGAIVTVAVSGYWIMNHYDIVKSNFSQELIKETYKEDLATEITNNEQWDIILDVDNYDIDIHYVDSSELEIEHQYFEKEFFTYVIDKETNEIKIYDHNEQDNNYDIHFGFTDLFDYIFNGNQSITIYLPNNLELDTVDLDVNVGETTIRGLHSEKIKIDNSLGAVTLKDITVESSITINVNTGLVTMTNVDTLGTIDVFSNTGSIVLDNIDAQTVTVDTNTGHVDIKNSISTSSDSTLNASTNTGDVNVTDVAYNNYMFDLGTGSIELENINVTLQDGIMLNVTVDTGSIELDDVYVDKVFLETTTGSIDYDNELDDTFRCTELVYDTTTGSSDVSVLTK